MFLFIFQAILGVPISSQSGELSRSVRFGHSSWRSFQSRRNNHDAHRRLINRVRGKSDYKIVGNFINGFQVQPTHPNSRRKNRPGQLNIFLRPKN